MTITGRSARVLAATRLPISLVIASHCRGAKIGPTLESVFLQTVAPEEVIVFNDGGFSETREFIGAAYPSVKVVDGVGGSPAASRNAGAAHATHPWVMFLDDDDVLLTSAVETLWHTLGLFPSARAGFADHTFTDAENGVHFDNHHAAVPSFRRLDDAVPIARTKGTRLYDRQLYYPMLYGGLLQQPWIVDRAAFTELGGFDTGFRSNEDWELYLRLVFAFPIALTDAVISHHIVEAGRSHVSRSESLEATGQAIVRKHLGLGVARRDIRAVLILRRRLGRMLKTDGDRIAERDLRDAWSRYRAALRMWPFDYVVCVRSLLLMPLQLLAQRFRASP